MDLEHILLTTELLFGKWKGKHNLRGNACFCTWSAISRGASNFKRLKVGEFEKGLQRRSLLNIWSWYRAKNTEFGEGGCKETPAPKNALLLFFSHMVHASLIDIFFPFLANFSRWHRDLQRRISCLSLIFAQFCTLCISCVNSTRVCNTPIISNLIQMADMRFQWPKCRFANLPYKWNSWNRSLLYRAFLPTFPYVLSLWIRKCRHWMTSSDQAWLWTLHREPRRIRTCGSY